MQAVQCWVSEPNPKSRLDLPQGEKAFVYQHLIADVNGEEPHGDHRADCTDARPEAPPPMIYRLRVGNENKADNDQEEVKGGESL